MGAVDFPVSNEVEIELDLFPCGVFGDTSCLKKHVQVCVVPTMGVVFCGTALDELDGFLKGRDFRSLSRKAVPIKLRDAVPRQSFLDAVPQRNGCLLLHAFSIRDQY